MQAYCFMPTVQKINILPKPTDFIMAYVNSLFSDRCKLALLINKNLFTDLTRARFSFEITANLNHTQENTRSDKKPCNTIFQNEVTETFELFSLRYYYSQEIRKNDQKAFL